MAPDIDDVPFQFMDLSLVNMTLRRSMTVHFCSNLFQETLFFGAVPPAFFWIMQVFDQNVIFVA